MERADALVYFDRPTKSQRTRNHCRFSKRLYISAKQIKAQNIYKNIETQLIPEMNINIFLHSPQKQVEKLRVKSLATFLR